MLTQERQSQSPTHRARKMREAGQYGAHIEGTNPLNTEYGTKHKMLADDREQEHKLPADREPDLPSKATKAAKFISKEMAKVAHEGEK